MSKAKSSKHELVRMQLWCDTFLALAQHDRASLETAKDWADEAVEHFDTQFRAPESRPTQAHRS